jgi:2-dehydro-3-deoxygluconokinase
MNKTNVPVQRTITFGEIMLRLSPPDNLRFTQARNFRAEYGGAEANVAVSLARFGLPVEFVTRLPDNDLGEACTQYLRGCGVSLNHTLRGGDRMGIYFLERGAAQRGHKVIYDRTNSSFASIDRGMFDWQEIFKGAAWFHWTGITPAISSSAHAALKESLQAARDTGLTISCDLNYRDKLWKWGREAGDVMPELTAYCDFLIGDVYNLQTLFSLTIPAEEGRESETTTCRRLCQALSERYPNLKAVALTQRGSLSASHTTWAGVLWSQGELLKSPVYHIDHVVERVGGGDAFSAGLIYALQTRPGQLQWALDFAAAASCLKHTIYGDANLVSMEEVKKLMAGEGTGRISR